MVKGGFSYISSHVHSSNFHIVMVVEVIDNYIMKLRRYVEKTTKASANATPKPLFQYKNVYKS
jgi:hypothetical protein